MVRKFVSNLNTITNISVHKGGENIIAGSKDGKVAWFQLDLSDKPYKLMDYHGDKIKNVEFHKYYPLFVSCSKNGKLLIYHASVFDDMIQEPLIVPLKVLKPDNTKNNSKYTLFI
jgi:ribosome biogenesis protein ERB1